MSLLRHDKNEIEIISIKPAPVFSLITCVGLVVAIISLILLDAFSIIHLSEYAKFIPAEILDKFPFAKNFINPFTLSLIFSIPIGLTSGLFFLIVSVLYNLFAGVMGGIKLELK